MHPVTSSETLAPTSALKSRTSDHHHRAERSEFQRLMVSGRLPQSDYVRWLGQMALIHRALESAFASKALDPRFGALMTAERRRSPDLARDLAHFGAAASDPLPATTAFIGRLDGWDGAGLAGALYVFEGSTNGGRHIARGVRKALARSGNGGTAFLDPYGEAQADRWRECKEALDRALGAEDLPAAIGAAEATFDAVAALGDDLLATRG
jgi:heme oxygenase